MKKLLFLLIALLLSSTAQAGQWVSGTVNTSHTANYTSAIFNIQRVFTAVPGSATYQVIYTSLSYGTGAVYAGLKYKNDGSCPANQVQLWMGSSTNPTGTKYGCVPVGTGVTVSIVKNANTTATVHWQSVPKSGSATIATSWTTQLAKHDVKAEVYSPNAALPYGPKMTANNITVYVGDATATVMETWPFDLVGNVTNWYVEAR